MDGEKETTTFMPLHSASYDTVNFYHKKLLCPDLDDLVIYGDFNAYTA